MYQQIISIYNELQEVVDDWPFLKDKNIIGRPASNFVHPTKPVFLYNIFIQNKYQLSLYTNLSKNPKLYYTIKEYKKSTPQYMVVSHNQLTKVAERTPQICCEHITNADPKAVAYIIMKLVEFICYGEVYVWLVKFQRQWKHKCWNPENGLLVDKLQDHWQSTMLCI